MNYVDRKHNLDKSQNLVFFNIVLPTAFSLLGKLNFVPQDILLC